MSSAEGLEWTLRGNEDKCRVNALSKRNLHLDLYFLSSALLDVFNVHHLSLVSEFQDKPFNGYFTKDNKASGDHE